MMNTRHPFSLFLITCSMGLSALNAETLIDFNTPGDYASNFSGSYTQSASAGIGGSGGVETSALSQVAVFQQSIDMTAFQSGYVSVLFQYNGADSTGAPLALGFTSSADDFYDTFSATSGTDIRLVLIGSAARDAYALNIRDVGIGGFARSADITLTPDAWYMAKLTIGNVDGGWLRNIVAELFEVDAAGNLGERIGLLDTLDIGGGPIDRENALARSTAVYPFFGGQEAFNRGVGVFDDFRFNTASTSGDPTWNGYEVGLDGWVDTGSWMGMVYVANDPWIWIHDLRGWSYVPDGSGWVYIPR